MSVTIVPKSDQLNADDLLAGPRTIVITSVTINPKAEQKVDVHFKGDGGKPYRPGKSMCRIMVAAWGRDPADYAGKRMTLYRDPSVLWAGLEVGGIRISHMSHIGQSKTMALTVTNKARKPFTVHPLTDDAPVAEPAQDRIKDGADALAARFAAVATAQDYYSILDDEKTAKQMVWLKANRPELFATVDAARVAASERMQDTPAPATTHEMENAQ